MQNRFDAMKGDIGGSMIVEGRGAQKPIRSPIKILASWGSKSSEGAVTISGVQGESRSGEVQVPPCLRLDPPKSGDALVKICPRYEVPLHTGCVPHFGFLVITPFRLGVVFGKFHI